VAGVNWILQNFYRSRSCILADEMGLGKTLQIISVINHIRTTEGPGCKPFLVVVARPPGLFLHFKIFSYIASEYDHVPAL